MAKLQGRLVPKIVGGSFLLGIGAILDPIATLEDVLSFVSRVRQSFGPKVIAICMATAIVVAIAFVLTRMLWRHFETAAHDIAMSFGDAVPIADVTGQIWVAPMEWHGSDALESCRVRLQFDDGTNVSGCWLVAGKFELVTDLRPKKMVYIPVLLLTAGWLRPSRSVVRGPGQAARNVPPAAKFVQLIVETASVTGASSMYAIEKNGLKLVA